MTVTYTAAEWKAFKTGAAVMADLRSKGIGNPKAASQTRNDDGSMRFEET